MNSSVFSSRMNAFAGGKCRRSIDRPCLIVAANANGYARPLHRSPDHFGHGLSFIFCGVGAEKQATHAQIEYQSRGGAQILIQHGGKSRSVAAQPVDETFAVRHRRQAASLAKRVMGKTRMNLC